MTYRVRFVCTGNICRSPIAESVFRARVADAGLGGLVEVDSAGTGGWHEGGGADGFGECLEMVEAASTGLLAAVSERVEGQVA
ncbi:MULTISPECIES: hypothetical protein [unclassified Streptomyces]|uniref:arsenate reductase/protein-tyrosine-phosphatase family protein n=1 Tax=unclassified Streptomyces TaxID=2593676 RepID=UPI0036F8C8E0